MNQDQKTVPCSTDPELFFPPGEEKDNPPRMQLYAIEIAKTICRQCEVRIECLEKAYENDEQFGIWGGMTSSERRKAQRATGRLATRLSKSA